MQLLFFMCDNRLAAHFGMQEWNYPMRGMAFSVGDTIIEVIILEMQE